MPKIISFLLALAFFSTSSAFAQTDSLTSPPTKALGFTFSGLNLGGGLAAKFQLGSGYWLRPEIRFSSMTDKTDNPLLDSLSSNRDYLQSSFALTAALEKHFNLTSDLSPYIGISAGMMYSYYRETDTYFTNTYNSRHGSLGLQGGMMVGVEFWLTKRISLAGEHVILLSYSWDSIDKRTTSNFGTSNSSLLLSIYL